MASIQEKTTKDKNATATTESDPHSKIDPTAPAGSKNSLGAESVRDGRPDTDDGTVEAMDEEGPDTAAPPANRHSVDGEWKACAVCCAFCVV